MFPRLYSLFLAGLYSATLSIPTLLHSRYFVTIESQTWLALIIIEFALVVIAQLSLMRRIYSQYQASNHLNMLINIIFVPVTCSLTSLSFVTLLSVSFLYNEYGNKYIELKSALITLDQNALISVLHFQLLASIFGGILFSLELYAELFRSNQEDSISLDQRNKKTRSNKNNKKGYRKSVTRSGSTFKPIKSLDTIHRHSALQSSTATEEGEDEEQSEASTTEEIDQEQDYE
jgi:hypothetical protein